MSAPKLLFIVTEDKYFLSHRLPMARAAQAAGYDVGVVTNVAQGRAAIEAAGIRVIPFSFERRSLNPFKAALQIWRLRGIYRRERPHLVHHIAMKPVLYGALAAWLAGVPRVINAFAGLGYVFTATEPKARLLRFALLAMFRPLLNRRGSILLLQNADDLALLRRSGVVRRAEALVIPGSGVELDRYPVQPLPPVAPDFIVAFSGRLIAIKGLATLRDAFALLRTRGPHIKLWLCGMPDLANPGSWTQAEIERWVAAAGNVVWRGQCDMADIWPRAHVAVQPSWGGEGVPKALLEAASCGRALIATDVAGCRDVVVEGINGRLVPPRDAGALADAILDLAADPAMCAAMGRESRTLVEARGFSATAIERQTEALYRSCLTDTGSRH